MRGTIRPGQSQEKTAPPVVRGGGVSLLKALRVSHPGNHMLSEKLGGCWKPHVGGRCHVGLTGKRLAHPELSQSPFFIGNDRSALLTGKPGKVRLMKAEPPAGAENTF